tara:strand:+ start:1878 stop:2882 length:1005 start_codon:yes stop_codon:yes gene_type:complete
MTIIDAIYIHSSGGLEILTQILDNLPEGEYIFLLDKRLKEYERFKKKGKLKILKANESNRKKFYRNNSRKINKVICIANVPPPLHIKKRVIIYFHNILLLNLKNSNIGLKSKMIYKLKRIYIKLINREHYEWVVQTGLMKKTLSKKIGVKESLVSTFPIFNSKKNNLPKKVKNSFLCVSSNDNHKNLKRVIIAFNNISMIIDKKTTLNLTLEDKAFDGLKPYIKNDSSNLDINNNGYMSKKQLYKMYEESEYLIFPSLKESFGLPLVEACNNGCKLICSDLPYIYEIVSPSYVFNPFSTQSISNSLIKALDGEVNEISSLRVYNKIDNFIKYIT